MTGEETTQPSAEEQPAEEQQAQEQPAEEQPAQQEEPEQQAQDDGERWDAPNQEAVGQPPPWVEGTGGGNGGVSDESPALGSTSRCPG